MKTKQTKQKICGSCKAERPLNELTQVGLRYACHPRISQYCAAELAIKQLDKKLLAERRARNRRTQELKKGLESRLDLYGKLGKLVNQHCKHVKYKGQSCYTCDKPQKPGDSPGSFHAGHFIPAKRVDPRRFMPENIRIQCYRCNSRLSGNQREYRKRLEAEKGAGWVEWLEAESNHKSLKDLYPNLDDIRAEIDKYRRMLREAGIKPNI